MAPTLVLMPGLDGTGRLFEPFLRHVPPDVTTHVCRYPMQETLDYDALFARLERELAAFERPVLLAESFSGPLAVRYAAAHQTRVAALVLVATFIRSPLPGLLNHVPLPAVAFKLSTWGPALRLALLGPRPEDDVLRLTRETIAAVPAAVLADRVGQVQRLDCSAELASVRCPILYLRATGDAVVSGRAAQQIRAVRPDVIVRRVDAPHFLLQAAPAAAWGEVRRFLAG
jgi:pimeloyl-ACP methyl ester carboxylesterase